MRRARAAAWLAAGLLAASARSASAASLDDALRSVRARASDIRLRTDVIMDPYALKIVKDLMGDPLSAHSRSQAVAEGLLASSAPSGALGILSDLLDAPLGARAAPAPGPGVPPLHPALRGPLSELVGALNRAQREIDEALRDLSDGDRRELLDWMKIQLTDATPDPARLSRGERWLEKDEKLLAMAGSVRIGRIISAGRDLLRTVEKVLPLLKALAAENPVKEKTVFQSDAGTVVLGSARAETFEEDAALIVDFGGDDVYRGAATAARPGKVRLILDLGGNDHYVSSGFGGLGGGVFGIDILVDAAGSDVYAAQDGALGAGLFGLGVLWDLEGDDLYRSRSFSQGAGAFGVGMLIDQTGSDVYRASYLSQGAGYVKGAGLLLDYSGNDSYSSGFGQPDPRGYIENYGRFKQGEVFQSLSQGFATGWRDMAAGGVGLLVDGAGNDVYQADYFAQGSAYWLSWGMLYDRSGNDVYQARRYSQGAGVHFAAGTLIDAAGNDRYISWAVSQGCGHDYALGLLWDRDGDDVYVADWTAMGASSAMGIGILRDQGGEDRYFTSQPAPSGWDDKRGAAGIGLLLDSGGARNRFSVDRATRAWNETRWSSGLAQEAELDWRLDPASEPADPGRSVYESFAAKDRAFLKARLEHAQGLGERTRISELLFVSAGWGMDGSVPMAAKRALLKEDPSRALPLLMEQLNPKSIYARLNLEEYFLSAPEQSRRALENVARSSQEPLLRARVCYYLGEIRSPESLSLLLEALRDPEWRVRAAAARALGVAQSGKFKDKLRKLEALLPAGRLDALQEWFSQREKSESLWVLALLPMPRERWPDFAEGLVQDEGTVPPVARKAAQYAMDQAAILKPALSARAARMERPVGLPELARALQDPDAEVRHLAAYSLGLLRAEPEALARALQDPDYIVREGAADSLAQMGSLALPVLKRVLDSGGPEARAVALRAIGGMDDKGTESVVRGRLRDSDGFVRLSALQALKEGRDKGLWKPAPAELSPLSGDANPWVQDLAQRLLNP